MTAERLNQIAERLREMARFAEDDYLYVPVSVSDGDYEVDLGVFGYRGLPIELENDSFELDAERILDKYPVTTNEFRDFADELESAASNFGGDLDTVLNNLKDNGEGALVSAVKSIVGLFRAGTEMTVDLSGLSVGALPPRPLPWPGAMRPGIDYTADDFPSRYQPPPGFNWARQSYDESVVDYREAVQIPAEAAGRNGEMVMDDKGRVKWMNRGDDDYTTGSRWRVWHVERDGVPRGRGMNDSTAPRALDRDGTPIEPTTIEDAWVNNDRYERAKARLQEIRAEFEAAPDGPVNAYGVTYDPLTVAVGPEGYAYTEELRLGDVITGPYGRLVAATALLDGKYEVVCIDNGRIRRDRRGRFNWLIRPVQGVDREKQPTALAATRSAILKYGYDPVTVETGERIMNVPTSELRAGDNVTPGAFGRVLSARPKEGDPTRVLITFDLNGVVKERPVRKTTAWTLLPVAGVNRDLLPPVLSVMDEQDGAPQQQIVDQQQTVGYDPLSVPVLSSGTLVKTSELRLGDDVIGGRWGRVTKVNADFTFEMNRDGTINTWDNPGDTSWEVFMIDVPDRDAVPAAVTLTQEPAEIAF